MFTFLHKLVNQFPVILVSKDYFIIFIKTLKHRNNGMSVDTAVVAMTHFKH